MLLSLMTGCVFLGLIVIALGAGGTYGPYFDPKCEESAIMPTCEQFPNPSPGRVDLKYPVPVPS